MSTCRAPRPEVSSESWKREIRTSGSTSDGWRRSHAKPDCRKQSESDAAAHPGMLGCHVSQKRPFLRHCQAARRDVDPVFEAVAVASESVVIEPVDGALAIARLLL